MTSNDPKQPQKRDVVLGGQAAMPKAGVVLGGLEGVQRRISDRNQDIEYRIAALQEALNYGQRGLDLLIRSLKDKSEQIQWSAYELLRDRSEPRVKLALELFSNSGVVYMPLRDLLAAGKWRQADLETTAIMRQLCKLDVGDRLNAAHFTRFPCEDLGLIDRLWRKYSNGHFGFSVQQPIWRRCDQSRWDKGEAWALFGDRVGWRASFFLFEAYHWKQYRELTFNLSAPRGHLPFVSGIFTMEAIANRLISCRTDS
ncbi:GUN4 domain-containing protein [Tumidithrix helvetica PCC 7403]|uniref:GUN4 domain-containing protein n=1 Tax=Tumidithrix helvetica TaxID=3457545 RepID=UPI003C945CD4